MKARSNLQQERDGWTRLDYENRGTWQHARGAESVLVIRPPPMDNVQPIIEFIDYCLANGSHVVYISTIGADMSHMIPHYAVEEHFKALESKAWTILRPGFFAQNLTTFYLADICEYDAIYVPAGSAKAAYVDLRDVGDAAAHVMTLRDEFRGRAIELVGPIAASFDEVAITLSEVTDRTIKYTPPTVIWYAYHLNQRGATLGEAAILTLISQVLRFSSPQGNPEDLQALLSHPARSVHEFIRDFGSMFRTERV